MEHCVSIIKQAQSYSIKLQILYNLSQDEIFVASNANDLWLFKNFRSLLIIFKWLILFEQESIDFAHSVMLVTSCWTTTRTVIARSHNYVDFFLTSRIWLDAALMQTNVTSVLKKYVWKYTLPSSFQKRKFEPQN